ncbi:MAG: hypothetical protein WA864_01375 [Acetobacteraceae bacterium]
MHCSLLMAAALVVTTAPVARADFVMTGMKTIQAASRQAASGGQDPAASPPEDGDHNADTSPAPSKPRFKTADGFGDQVPLSFACRQIIPPAVKVTLGPGADPKALVDWKGGDTWNHVLRDAVKPLGLHLVMTTMAVEIRN